MEISNKLIKAAKVPAIVTILLLLIPLLAMQITSEVDWDETDFIVMGILIFATGFSFKLVTMKSDNFIYKTAVGLAFFTGFFLVWSNLAVGIIGSEDNPVNLLYFAILAVGIIGAFFTRFQPQKMAFVMFAIAVAHVLIAGIVLIGGFYQSPPSTVFHIIAANGFFITLFSMSGGLFWLAAEKRNGMDLETSA
jgi:hypothetical protein